jgi:hypothetical protein
MIRAIFFLFLLPVSSFLQAQTDSISVSGQVIGWAGMNFVTPAVQQAGGRILPELFYQHAFRDSIKLDIDLSANMYGNLMFSDWNFSADQSGLKPYRAALRLSSEQWELRAGLQKISFGSATLLRPLMWFDGIDPRDPLQLTEGVYGLLGRYYFLNNGNIWAWGLIGNKDLRGWDPVPSLADKPEYGGRIQWPIMHGEAGITYNHRQPGSNKPFMLEYYPNRAFRYKEDKIGIDGKWSIGPGIWFEYVLRHNRKPPAELHEYENYLTVGSDYTFALGNGLNLLVEHFWYSGRKASNRYDVDLNITASSLSYPLGLMNRISAMVYRGWEANSWFEFLNIQRQYDNFSIYLMLFRNPEKLALYSLSEGASLYGGTGFVIMATYNF